jgi:hypothetical protein
LLLFCLLHLIHDVPLFIAPVNPSDQARAATTQLKPVADFAALQTQLLATFRTENCVYAIRIKGEARSPARA